MSFFESIFRARDRKLGQAIREAKNPPPTTSMPASHGPSFVCAVELAQLVLATPTSVMERALASRLIEAVNEVHRLRSELEKRC